MNMTRGRIAAFLLGAILAFPTFFGASWAREQVVSGYPTFTEGDELWGRKSGTTNTKEDVEVTSGALHIFSEGGTAATPPTGASATQVQGTAAHDAASVGSPVRAGARARTAAISAVAQDDAVDLIADTNGALLVKSPKPATIDTSFTAQAADFTVEAATANLRIKGWSIRESAAGAAVATVVIRHDADGTCDSTAVVAFVELSANQSLQQDYGPDGLAAASGLCVDVIAGEVDFAAYLKTEASL